MIRVLIVEDEPPTLRRIAGMVEKLDPAFIVAATAMNGQIALQKMAETQIDVVFTDIRMPVMDGMALMNRIRENDPECIIVALSGYSDFEYVSHAIRARSLDYLLKPVSADELQKVLTRIREQVNVRDQERLKRSLSMHLNKSEAGASDRVPSEEQMGICLFCAGAFPFSDDAEMYPAASFWSDHSLEKTARDIVPGFMDFTWEFMGNTPVERILIFQPKSDQFMDWVRVLHEATLTGDIPVSCACLSELITLDGTNNALRKLRRALRSGVELGRGLFLTVGIEGEPGSEEKRLSPDKEQMRRWAAMFLSGLARREDGMLRDLFDQIERERWTQQNILDFFLGMAVLMDQEGADATGELTGQYQTVLAEAVCTSLSLRELEAKILSLIPSQEDAAPGESMRQTKIVDDIERYLRENYAEHITNRTLALAFGYVPSYISLLFRQRYKLSPSEYLTQIRIDRAKTLIKTQPELLIREVAEKVGFKSQHHFSRIFKKNEGVQPTSYQT